MSDLDDKKNTEDGTVNVDIEKLKKSRAGYRAAITKKYNEIDRLLLSHDNHDLVVNLNNSLAEAWHKFADAHRLVVAQLIDNEDALQENEAYYQNVRQEMVEFDKIVTAWIDDSNMIDNIKPKDSASQTSRRSQSSSILLKKSEKEAARRVAELRLKQLEQQTKIDDIKRQLQLKHEEEERHLQQQAAILKAKAELEECKIQEEVFKDMAESVVSTRQRAKSATASRVKASTPHNHTLTQRTTLDPVDYMAQTSAALFLPKQELQAYDGDPLEYWNFTNSFKTLIEEKTNVPSTRLHYLVQYTSGDVKELVRSCVPMEPSLGYAQALHLLKSRYGQDYRIATAYVDKITKGASIKSEDSQGLHKLSVLLTSCYHTLSNIGCINHIQNPDALRAIIGRLPFELRRRWRSKADYISEEQRREIKLEDIVHFIEKEARAASHPIFGDIKTNEQAGKKDKDAKNQSKNKKSFAAVTTSTPATTPTTQKAQGNQTSPGQSSGYQAKCPSCQASHKLRDCPTFQKKDLESRVAEVMRVGACFNCLVPKHPARDCRNAMRCATCGKKHHTLVHQEDYIKKTKEPSDKSESTASTTVGATVGATVLSQSERIGLPIVPVKLRSPSGKLIKTNAFLDNGSTMTFITEDLINQLGIEGKQSRILLSTLEHSKTLVEGEVYSIQVADDKDYLELSPVMRRPSLPITDEDIPKQSDIDRWPYLHGIHLKTSPESVGLLIGNDNADVIQPLEIRKSQDGGPYAVRTRFGWTINGPLGRSDKTPRRTVNMTKAYPSLTEQFQEFCNLEFRDSLSDPSVKLSVNDEKALRIMDESTQMKDNHYILDLPLKEHIASPLPDSKPMVMRRFDLLHKRLKNDGELLKMYTTFMEDLFTKGYAEIIPDHEATNDESLTWYLPHHAVVNPNKPGKVRVVFDCSAKCYGPHGQCLNDLLLQGPDFNNSLIGVLLRFRELPVALIADVEAMFYQVQVSEKHRDLLRFMWWRDGQLDSQPSLCRMKVHIFGAKSSPSCCSYAMRRTAIDNKADIDKCTHDTVLSNFYMDDCLVSTETEEAAIKLRAELSQTLAKGGFHLTKWISNSTKVLDSIPQEERAADIRAIDISKLSEAPMERALGVRWNIHSDAFTFSHIQGILKEKPQTRRGILSIMSSVFDPLGFVSPVLLPIKLLLQELCRLHTGWDDPVPDDYLQSWRKWLLQLPVLSQFEVNRCLQPMIHSNGTSTREIHHFSDASEKGYGCVSYLRTETSSGEVTVSFLLAKSRVSPIKKISIPRLELSAATLAVRLDQMLRRELLLAEAEVPSTFWTDSTSVLKYINNENTRFHVFVANRLSVIRDGSSRESWRYVMSSQNPADDASRGLSAEELLKQERWLSGPPFLMGPKSSWPAISDAFEPLTADDPDVKVLAAVETSDQESPDVLERLLTRFSSWFKLQKSVAWLLRFRKALQDRVLKKPGCVDISSPITVTELKQAEHEVVKIVQQSHYKQEIKTLQQAKLNEDIPRLKKSSTLFKLNPTLEDNVLRIRGRLSYSSLDNLQYILPSRHHVSSLIIQHYHILSGHSGRQHVLSLLREKFWIVQGNAAVRRVIGKCVKCKCVQGNPGQQRMADLPEARLQANQPPFHTTGIDFFGPFMVRRGRARVKRYALLLTCMTTRAVHLELAYGLDTDSFLNCLNRFIARRGQPHTIYSDNGGSFVKGEREIRDGIAAWNKKAIHSHLLNRGIAWCFSPPLGSHHGGIWERCIRTARKILNSLLTEQPLDDDGLHSLLCEVESIMNCRPITSVSSDHRDLEALTPNHLLLFKAGDAKLPLDVFDQADVYKRRWRQVQYLSDVFWRRWVKDYLPTLKARQKWNSVQKNFAVGNLVLMIDPLVPRNVWPLGRVTKVFPGRDGLVRSVEVRSKNGTYERPIDKLVMLDNCDI